MRYKLIVRGILAALGGLMLLFSPAATGADDGIVELKTRTGTYTNVTVARRDGTNIYIRHAGGVANVKLEELDPDAQRSLGYTVATPTAEKTGAASMTSRPRPRSEKPSSLIEVEFAKGVNLLVWDREIHLGYTILAGLVLAYLLFCCCSYLLCKKTGNEPGILIWFPVLQMFPLLRAAGMSGWWVVALFVPVLNVVAWLGWCVNIVITRRKSLWWALLMILPFTNVIAFLYLALAESE